MIHFAGVRKTSNLIEISAHGGFPTYCQKHIFVHQHICQKLFHQNIEKKKIFFVQNMIIFLYLVNDFFVLQTI